MTIQTDALIAALELMRLRAKHGLELMAATVADPSSVEPYRTLHQTLNEILATADDLHRQLSPRVAQANEEEQPGDQRR